MRRVVLILLTLVVLAPSAVNAATLYQCAVDGRVRTACCCPVPKHRRAPTQDAEIRGSSCCKVTQISAQDAPARVGTSVALDAAPLAIPVAFTIAFVVTPIQVQTVRAPRSQRGPPAPLFVRHCSLLL